MNDYAALQNALKNQRRIDEDGCEVGVSRQACDEAAELVGKFVDLERQLATKDKALREAESVLEFIKTALPVIQCITGKIGLDLGEAKSIEMQKAANDALASIQKALA